MLASRDKSVNGTEQRYPIFLDKNIPNLRDKTFDDKNTKIVQDKTLKPRQSQPTVQDKNIQ